MNVKHTTLIKVFLLATLYSGSAWAANASLWNNVEISGAGGVNWINTEDTHLDITPFETDKLQVNNTTVEGAFRAGIGYYLFVNRLLVELNVYGASNTVEGNVWQYELPQFNNYTFSAPISSTRLMLDFKPNLVTWNKLTPYLILGVGASWNMASYKEESDAGIDPSGARSLSDNTQVQLAWDVGAGLSYALTDRLSITGEYVYAFLGEATPQGNDTVIASPNFSYQIQSLLFGLSFRL